MGGLYQNDWPPGRFGSPREVEQVTGKRCGGICFLTVCLPAAGLHYGLESEYRSTCFASMEEQIMLIRDFGVTTLIATPSMLYG